MNEYLGKFLIASPKLDQTEFARTVVYVFQDNEDATVGVVLNCPADDKVRQAWQGMVGKEPENGLISIGGPIPGPVIAVHRNQKVAEINLPNGIFTSASQNSIEYLASQNEVPFHVFFGLTGWQPGQLEAEVNAGQWVSIPVIEDLLFRSSCELWHEALKAHENRFHREVLGIQSFPKNILDN